jgi:hypothetical protein
MRQLILCMLCSLSLVSCNNNEEQDDLAKAQKCLDEVPQSDPAQAEGCLQHIEKYTSQQAQILKCSIYMTAGGLVENKIVQAYKILKDDTLSNKETAYMVVLSLDIPDVNSGYDKAKAADVYCQASGVSGLRYLSGVIVAGTYLRKIAAAVPGGGNIDMNDPNSIKTVVNNLIAQCTPNGTTPDSACFAGGEINTLGAAVENLSNSYCGREDADASVCGQVRDAVNISSGDASDAGQALMCALAGKKYDATNNYCTP